MELAIFKEYGVLGILLFLAVKTLYDIFKKQKQQDDDVIKYNTIAVQSLTASLDKLKEQIAEIPKLKTDVKRSFAAHKIIAGEKWPEIRKEIMEEL